MGSGDTRSVDEVVAALDETTSADCAVLVEMMQGISGHEPRVWNVATLGFDTYRFAYDSGREGDGHALGFYPRKGKLTIHLMDGTARHTELLDRLGAHTTSRVCVSLTRLSDVDLGVLDEVLRASYDYVKEHDGQMHRA